MNQPVGGLTKDIFVELHPEAEERATVGGRITVKIAIPEADDVVAEAGAEVGLEIETELGTDRPELPAGVAGPRGAGGETEIEALAKFIERAGTQEVERGRRS